MVLNTELKEIMMDHALRTISYIADIGDLVVLMARRRFVPHETDSDQPKLNRTPKMICHVFESEEVSAFTVWDNILRFKIHPEYSNSLLGLFHIPVQVLLKMFIQ